VKRSLLPFALLALLLPLAIIINSEAIHKIAIKNKTKRNLLLVFTALFFISIIVFIIIVSLLIFSFYYQHLTSRKNTYMLYLYFLKFLKLILSL